MIAAAGAVLVASLLGSTHCAGMCGGFVAFYAGQDDRRSFLPHALYHAGRLAAYLALGVVAGLVGEALDRVGALAGLHRVAALVAGGAMLAWGSAALLRATGHGVPRRIVPAAMHRLVAAPLRAIHAQPPALRALVVGLVTALLPCGWLWLYVATAAGAGSVLASCVVMFAFWLGTVPILAGLAVATQRLLGPLRRRLPVWTAVFLVVLGFVTIGGHFHRSATGIAACPRCASVEHRGVR